MENYEVYYENFAFLEENLKVLPCDAKLMFHNKIGIGESKCPYEHRDSDLMDVAMSNKNFYLQVVGSNLHLKHEHSYYFQVQCQLALTGAAFNDFVVYTHRSLFIERFAFDEQFWTNAVRKVGKLLFLHPSKVTRI